MRVTPSTYFKLGLFVLTSLAVALIGAVAVGAHVVERETASYHIYFDESVQGLDVGAPVKFRGVKIGDVAAIEIAPDRRHVDVVAELDVRSLRRMGLTEEGNGSPRFLIPPDLRAQVAMQGLTGVKLVLIDFFDPEAFPAPELPFAVPENTIPSTSSLLKNVEDRLYDATEMLATVGAELTAILRRVDGLIEALEKKGFSGKVVELADELLGALRDVRRVVNDVDRARLPARMAKSFDKLEGTLGSLDATLTSVNSTNGLLASAKRATESLADLGESAIGDTRTLGDTLADVSEAAQSIRRLADALERDPDMLLKGRANGASR